MLSYNVLGLCGSVSKLCPRLLIFTSVAARLGFRSVYMHVI